MPETSDQRSRISSVLLSRRNFLIIGGLASASSAGLLWWREASSTSAAPAATGDHSVHATTTASPSPTPSPTPSAALRWSDPATWPDGKVPAPGSAVTVGRDVILDVDAAVASLSIEPNGSLTFDPEASRTLTSTGNIVVHGGLALLPSSARIDHAIVFEGVRERDFVGDGSEVLDTDVGLWVMHDGVIDLAGASRLGWSRIAGDASAGDRRIELVDDPVGWRPGDELVVAPTAPPRDDEDDSEDGFESVRIASVSGRTVTLDGRLRRDHPSVRVGGERLLTAEVLNLTRNVRIEGTSKGRAHVMIHSSRPQSIRYAAFRHLGPRQPAEEFTAGVIGRYPLHFHLCEDGSRESMVDGAVVRDCGNHAFVPHTSHGVTFRDCVCYDTYDDAYWWDQAPDTRTPGPPTDDTTYERCVAALARHDPPFRGYRLNGFALSRGNGNIARSCVAVGIQGNGDASGFHWPEGSEGVWTFEDCIAHNNVNGIFTWQNTDTEHVIKDFVAYHNREAGIAHGAYGNPYHYRDSILHGNSQAAIRLNAISSGKGLRFTNLICDGAGRSEFLVETAEHVFEPDEPTLFTGCTFIGASRAAFGLVGGDAELIQVTDCTFDGNEFWLADDIDPASELRVRDRAHGSLVLRRNDQEGDLNADWNARVVT